MMIYLQMLESNEDKQKFEQLYIVYRGLMFHAAMQLLSNEQDAEDAVHQAFLSILECFSGVSEVRSPKTRSFVVIITERKAIDIMRKKSRAQTVPYDDLIGGVDIPLPGDHGLSDAMAQLPTRYREMLLLRYDNGYSTREIAKLFGISPDAAQKLLWRSKQALQTILDKEGFNI